jgi:hypothetical protein
MESIFGPYCGFYVASCAWPSEDGARWTGYAKVCRRAPRDYWDAEVLFKVFGGEHHADAQSALRQARRAACARIARIPEGALPLLDIALRDASRRLLAPLLSAIRSHLRQNAPL